MIRVDCEWDIGNADIVFTSMSAAMAWLNANVGLAEAMAMENETLEDLFYAGLVTLTDIEVIG